jgi:replicative DNA helicase
MTLPEGCNDVNDMLRAYPDDFEQKFRQLIQKASRFEVENVSKGEDRVAMAFSMRKKDEACSPWWGINTKLTVAPGHLICLSADPKVGKTSMALEWARYRVNAAEDSVFFYCLEMDDIVLTQKLLQLQFDAEKSYLLDRADHYLPLATTYFEENPERWLFSYKNYPESKHYISLIKETVLRYGCKWVVFDHFHKLVQSLKNPNQEQANLAVAFKRLAVELEIVLLLIVQPRKTHDTPKKQGVKFAEDMAGSHMIRAEADSIITLSRPRITTSDESDSVFEPKTIVRIESRHDKGGVTTLWFHGETQKFYPYDMGAEMEEVASQEPPPPRAAQKNLKGDPVDEDFGI